MPIQVKLMLYVRDMKRAIAFYRESFGATVQYESEFWSELDIAGSCIALHLADNLPATTQTGLIFKVDGLDATCSRVEGNQGTLLERDARPEEGIELASCQDPEGNVFSVVRDL